MIEPFGLNPFGGIWNSDDTPTESMALENRIINYLPAWIPILGVIADIITSIAESLYTVSIEIFKLPLSFLYSTGAIHAMDDWKIFFSGTEDESTLQAALAQVYTIHQMRGTASGQLADLKRITADNSATINNVTGGWFLDTTFPDITNYVFLDVGAVSVIDFTNHGTRSEADIEELLRKEIFPIKNTLVFI